MNESKASAIGFVLLFIVAMAIAMRKERAIPPRPRRHGASWPGFCD
jgi:hypothetical protein